MPNSLWGDAFNVDASLIQIKDTVKKASSVKSVQIKKAAQKQLNLQDQIHRVSKEVNRVLGRYKGNTEVITDLDRFENYLRHSVQNNLIAIDTETNNSLDVMTCKLMGLCLYTPNDTNVYIPVNHRDINTGKRLDYQLTENDIKQVMQEHCPRIKEVIMHNGKFDYEVIRNTCGVDVLPTWDTNLGARLLNENEPSGLKAQYIAHIDATQQKYDIEHLFDKLPYELFPPEVFALYSATDPYMTYRLYEYQKEQYAKAENAKVYNLFLNVEMPIIEVVASMELYGVHIDTEYAKRLSEKYHNKLVQTDSEIEKALHRLKPNIEAWRKTKDALFKPEPNARIKNPKSKSEQLSDPPQLTSNQQMAILLYDVLKVPTVDKKAPRGTGEDILLKIQSKYPNIELCNLILQKRNLEKLIGTYIDKIPAMISPTDNRLHGSYNQYGAKTGRFSSQDPNLQNLPSHNKEIRLLFSAGYSDDTIQDDNNQLRLYKSDCIQCVNNQYKSAEELSITDIVVDEDGIAFSIVSLDKQDDYFNIKLKTIA